MTDSGRLRNYVAWHDSYADPGSRLHLRLLVVQEQLQRSLDELREGPINFVSMCAGQGHDILGVARRHRRGADLRGRLVEAEPVNAAAARAVIEEAGLENIEVVEGDAGRSDAYIGAVPADLVLVCGVFGNITEDDIANTISFLPALCAPGAWVVWTRVPRPEGFVQAVERRFTDAGFEPRALVISEPNKFGVGAAQLTRPPNDFEPGVRLFDFIR